MAKKAKGPTLAERIEKAVREAVAAVPGIDKVDELTYCDAVLEALEMFGSGIEMRKGELEAADEE